MADIKELQKIAKRVRKDIVKMTFAASSGHPGGSLSCADILTALYFSKLRINPKKPEDPDRDRFVLSKGHAVPCLYAVLAERGFFPVKDLKNLRKLGSYLQGHPDKIRTPGVEASTGSLGQGLSIANGMALAGKLDKKDYRVYALIGDGESDEGNIWEAAMAGAHYKLDNLTAILDRNMLQIDGKTKDVMSIAPVDQKWRAFGWHVIVINGHNFEEILHALDKSEKLKGAPTMIIANTVKGRGVSFMENKYEWHGIAPDKEQVKKALEDLK